MIIKFLENHHLNIKSLNNIFVNQGPGKFSGIRASLAIAKALSFANKIDLYGFNSDQSPRPTEKTYWTNYLNVNVPFFTGGERTAKKYNYPVVFASAKRIKRGYYSFEIFPIITKNSSLYNITDQFVDFLQEKIRENPSEYLWTHNRFKYKDLYSKFNQKS